MNISKEKQENRLESVRKRFGDHKANALIVTYEPNVTYLTGFTGDSSALIVTNDQAWIVSDFRYVTQLEQESPGLEVQIRPASRTIAEELGMILSKLGLSTVGIESDSMTVSQFEEIRKASGTTELIPTRGLVESLRVLKDEDEIKAIREAIRAAEEAYLNVRLALQDRALHNELQMASVLTSKLQEQGASAPSFPPIVASGPHAALPHARPRADAKLSDADFILVDWGASMTPLPYKSDLTRVMVTGIVSATLEQVHRIVVDAQKQAIAAIRPGISAGAVDQVARSVIANAGFGERFGHGLGHGIGLEIHESPRLKPISAEILVPGMILTVEPGIYLPDWGGVRIEDDVLVTESGAEVLSTLPKDLDIVSG